MVSFFRPRIVSTDEASAERYLGELSRELRRRLPDAETSEILTETEAHLHDQIEDQKVSGVAEAIAVREAIQGFGPPKVFARHAANGITNSRSASLSRIGLRIMAGGIFALAASFTLYSGSSPWLLSYLSSLSQDSVFLLHCLGYGTGIITLAFLVFAFSGRRANTRFLLGGGAVLLASSVMAVGLYKSALPSGQWVDRRQVPNCLEFGRRMVSGLEEENRLLRTGIAVYGTNSSPTIPGALKQGNRYIVPIPTQVTINGVTHDLTATENAFRPIARYEAQGASTFRVRDGKNSYETVSSYEKARARWESDSQKWLNKSIRNEREERERLRQYEVLEQRTPSFRLDCLWWDDLWSVPFTAAVVLLDWLAASAGRHIALANRRRRRNQTA